jgi:hypothetical protein
VCKGEKSFVIAESGEKGIKNPKTGGYLRITAQPETPIPSIESNPHGRVKLFRILNSLQEIESGLD